MQFSEAKTYVANTKLNVNLTDIAAGTNQLFALQDIVDAINLGLKRAWDYKPWTFTEKTYYFALSSGMLTAGYVDYPNNFEDESVYRLTVNGVEFVKKDFKDYEKWFSDYPTDTTQIWSEHE